MNNAFIWVRGVARVRGGWVTLDEATTTRYSPPDEPDLLREFLAIGTARDVGRFASRFGLLRAPDETGLREPLSDWWDEIGLVSGALKVQLDVVAALRGDKDDVVKFRESWQATKPDARGAGSDTELIAEARATVLAAVNRRLGGAQLEISIDSSHGYVLSPRIPDLVGFIYFELAKVLIEDAHWRYVSSAARRSSCTIRRQRYCSERHASRARYRRFQEQREGARVPVEIQANGPDCSAP